MIAALLLCASCSAPLEHELADHARAQRAARIARFQAAWAAAEVGPRAAVSARLAPAGAAWPSDAELDAATALLTGRAEPTTESERALQALADALDAYPIPGWAEGVSAGGADGAFVLRVQASRAFELPGELRLSVTAPRLARVLGSRTVSVAELGGAGVEIPARVPVETEVAVELELLLERASDARVETARSRRSAYPLIPGLGARIAALPHAASEQFPRVDVPTALAALDLLGASGLQSGLTRDPLLLLGALELNAVIASQAEIAHHGRGGLRLCGPLALGADSARRWVGWQAGPALERIVWFWCAPEQPYDALFIGPDPLAQEWQRLASGRGWLLVANEPADAAVAAACLTELRAAFPGLPVTLFVRGDVAPPPAPADQVLRGAQLKPSAVASEFLFEPELPRAFDAWLQARR
jgi:hypothetical protein